MGNVSSGEICSFSTGCTQTEETERVKTTESQFTVTL